MRTCVLLLAATVTAAAFAGMFHLAQAVTETLPPLSPQATATIAPTCQAAHDADSRVSASFCIAHLRKQPRAIYANTTGLAEAAATVGVRNANAARDETQRMLERCDEGDEQDDDPIYRVALERCDRYYGMIGEWYTAARKAIDEQRYGDVERQLSSVPTIAHSCDYGFSLTRRAAASPFLRYNEDATHIALLTIAITGLIKP